MLLHSFEHDFHGIAGGGGALKAVVGAHSGNPNDRAGGTGTNNGHGSSLGNGHITSPATAESTHTFTRVEETAPRFSASDAVSAGPYPSASASARRTGKPLRSWAAARIVASKSITAGNSTTDASSTHPLPHAMVPGTLSHPTGAASRAAAVRRAKVPNSMRASMPPGSVRDPERAATQERTAST